MSINPDALAHIVICEASGLPRAQGLASHLATTSSVDFLVLDAPADASLQALHQALRERLGCAKVGVQLHVFGSETFIWKIHAQAIAQGLSNEEISLCAPLEHNERRIYCVHCSAVHSHPLSEAVKCTSCGVALEVRAHFSRRLGAYLGVCLNADAPYGELPA